MVIGGIQTRWRRYLFATIALAVVATAGVMLRQRRAVDPALLATVQRGMLTVELSASGTLRPIQSLTYRSPLVGRELEILELVAEGTRVKEGDLLLRLDSTELQKDIDRLRQELRQLQLDLQVAHAERQEAEAALQMATEGDGALTVEEARMRSQMAHRKVDRLRQEFNQLKPLLDKGFITRDELARTSNELEQAEEELALARKRSDIVSQLTHPREKQRASLQLAQRKSQIENMVGRVQETEARLQQILAIAEACTITAKRPGLVVYEQFLNASPRRKIRVGDRVSASQGLVTIPEVNRMLVEASVSEAEVHRLRPGQRASVRLEAFPTLRLSGRVARVGALASSSIERPLEDKRFDLVVEVDSTDAELRPEMSARVDIVLDRRDDVLLVPVTAIFEQQGTFRAHVAAAFGVESRVVEIGESNHQLVEVRSGLRERERVLLVEPAAAAPSAAPAAAGSRHPSSGITAGAAR